MGLMPLDRRITIEHKLDTVRDEHGESTLATIATYSLYATVMPKSQAEQAEEGGTFTARNRDYRIRYHSALAAIRPSDLFIDAGETAEVMQGVFEKIIYKGTNIYEDTGRNGEVRRRWMVLQCTYTR